jgi:hypothetical protein
MRLASAVVERFDTGPLEPCTQLQHVALDSSCPHRPFDLNWVRPNGDFFVMKRRRLLALALLTALTLGGVFASTLFPTATIAGCSGRC